MHSCAEQDAVPSHAMFPIARLAATGLCQTGCLIFHSRGRGFSLSVGGPERLTNACRRGQGRSAKRPGRVCRIPCHGPRCFRSTPGSRTPLLRLGNILRLFSFGGQGAQWNGAALPTGSALVGDTPVTTADTAIVCGVFALVCPPIATSTLPPVAELRAPRIQSRGRCSPAPPACSARFSARLRITSPPRTGCVEDNPALYPRNTWEGAACT